MAKSMDEALATLGQMKFRILPSTPEAPNEALLMIRHPNNSGLQMDQVTRLYTPPRYIDKLAVYQGQDLVFSMAAGISISEDPNFRFAFKPNGPQAISRGSRGHGWQDVLGRMARDPRRRVIRV
jgi:sulfur-oxidizing protein SoxY